MARDTHIYGEIDSTRGDGRAIIPKVKRVYIAGELSNWEGWYHQKAQRPSGSWGTDALYPKAAPVTTARLTPRAAARDMLTRSR
jgi:hypothetical protein